MKALREIKLTTAEYKELVSMLKPECRWVDGSTSGINFIIPGMVKFIIADDEAVNESKPDAFAKALDKHTEESFGSFAQHMSKIVSCPYHDTNHPKYHEYVKPKRESHETYSSWNPYDPTGMVHMNGTWCSACESWATLSEEYV